MILKLNKNEGVKRSLNFILSSNRYRGRSRGNKQQKINITSTIVDEDSSNSIMPKTIGKNKTTTEVANNPFDESIIATVNGKRQQNN